MLTMKLLNLAKKSAVLFAIPLVLWYAISCLYTMGDSVPVIRSFTSVLF